MAFIHNGPYFLTYISIYQDEIIDCWDLVDFEQFKEKVRSGWVVTQPPEGATVSVCFLANFKAVEAQFWISPEELIKEVADEIESLNGRPSSKDKCLDAWKRYQTDPTDLNRSLLKEACEAMPEQNRRYVLGDMDVKDVPIRMVLYGEQEIENWTHRAASRAQGLNPLPNIQVPKPKGK